MVRDYYSYWLAISSDDPDTLAQAQAWLQEHSIVPDYLRLSDQEATTASYDVGECGTIEQTDEILNALKKLAEEMPSLCILFDENDEDDHSIHMSHYWHNRKYVMDASGEASNEELRLKADDPERYEFVRARRVLSGLCAKLDKEPKGVETTLLSELLGYTLKEIDLVLTNEREDTACKEPPHKKLAGGYYLIPAKAHLSNETFNALSGEYLAVEEPYLLDYINGLGYSSLAEFLVEHTTEDTDGLEGNAELNHALGFVYTPEDDEPFRFPVKVPGRAMLAFADFLSNMLQESGQDDASKYIDCLFDL